MKRIDCLFFITSLIFVFGFDCGLYGGENSEKLQALHKEIGNKLIKIKKEHPQAQQLVYSILDQLGKYHSVSKDVLGRKKEYKKLFKAENKRSELWQEKAAVLEEKIMKMKKMIEEANDKMKKDFAVVSGMKEQKDAFMKERELFIKEKQKLISERDALLRERDELLQEREAIVSGKMRGEKVCEMGVQGRVYSKADNSVAQPAGGIIPQGAPLAT